MASCAANFIKLFNFNSYKLVTTNLICVTPDFIQARNYAARKGTREKRLKALRAKKSSKKPEEKPKRFMRKEVTVEHVARRIKENLSAVPLDDVVVCKYYRWKIYDFAEAIQCHRETHHPTVYNKPSAYVQANIELDMTAAKKNRFVDTFTRLAEIPHPFPMGEPRSILVFCKTSEEENEAIEAGANVAGGSALIKEIEKGDVSLKDFDHILAHPNILPEMVVIRGLMRKTFPNVRSGTLGVDIKSLVKKFRNGINYTAEKDSFEQDYGLIQVNVGTLDMEVEHLQKNLQSILKDVYSVRPKRPGPFITRVLICSAPSVEKIKVDVNVLLPEQADDIKDDVIDSDEDDDEEEEVQVKKNVTATV